MKRVAVTQTHTFWTPPVSDRTIRAVTGYDPDDLQVIRFDDERGAEPHTVDWWETQRKQARAWESQKTTVRSAERVAYLGWTWIPLALDLGARVGPGVRLDVFQRHHKKLDWAWPEDNERPEFQRSGLPDRRQTDFRGDVAVRISTSYHIEPEHTHEVVPEAKAVDIGLARLDPERVGLDPFSSQDELHEFVDYVLATFRCIRDLWPNATGYHLFLAGGTGLAFALGAALNPTPYPPIIAWQYQRTHRPFYRRAFPIGRSLTEIEMKIRILFLGSDPQRGGSQGPLAIAQEIREIQRRLLEGEQRDRFELDTNLDVEASNLQAILSRRRDSHAILHFSGHGTEDGSIIVDGPAPIGRAAPRSVRGEDFVAALVALQAVRPFRMVVLNACWSGSIAETLVARGVVPVAIGMDAPVQDDAAIFFAQELYRSLADGLPIRTAFDLAVNQIRLNAPGRSGADIPRIYGSHADLQVVLSR